MRHANSNLTRLARSVVEPMGYELVGVEYLQQGTAGAVLRVYIDRGSADAEDKYGITVDDCAAVSHQLSGVLDVEDPIPGEYHLEVSSPGLDRPLFTAAHYERFSGSRVRIRLAEKLDGRRRFEGSLAGLRDDRVLIVVDGETHELPLQGIEAARLVPEL